MGANGGLVAAIQHDEEICDPDPPVSPIVKPEIVVTAQCEDPETGPVALQAGCDLEEMAGKSAKRLYAQKRCLRTGQDYLFQYTNCRGRTTEDNPLGVKEEGSVTAYIATSDTTGGPRRTFIRTHGP